MARGMGPPRINPLPCLPVVTLVVRELREGHQGSLAAPKAGRRFMIVENRACYAHAILHDPGNQRVLKIKPAGLITCSAYARASNPDHGKDPPVACRGGAGIMGGCRCSLLKAGSPGSARRRGSPPPPP